MKLEEYKLPDWVHFKIRQKRKVGDKKILLLSIDRAIDPPIEGRKNLIAVNNNNDILWIADLPTEVYDSYYKIEYKNNIIYARSSNSYMAEIEPNTGEMLKKYMVY